METKPTKKMVKNEVTKWANLFYNEIMLYHLGYYLFNTKEEAEKDATILNDITEYRGAVPVTFTEEVEQ